MNGASNQPARKSKRVARRLSLPVNDAIEEVLARMPDVMRTAGSATGRDNYALLALYEGLLTLAEHFETIEKTRPLRRSDLVFRFEVMPGLIGRAAQAEQEARAIEALLNAATKAAQL